MRADNNYCMTPQTIRPLQTPSPVSVAQRCAAIEAGLLRAQVPAESSTATESPSTCVADTRQHAQQTPDRQQQLQHASTDSRGAAHSSSAFISIRRRAQAARRCSHPMRRRVRHSRPRKKPRSAQTTIRQIIPLKAQPISHQEHVVVLLRGKTQMCRRCPYLAREFSTRES